MVTDPETGGLVGLVTESDIMRQVAADADVESVPVGSFMTASVVTIGSADPIHAAVELMEDRSIRRLPVVDDGALVGIVTTTNLVHDIPRLRNSTRRARSESAGR